MSERARPEPARPEPAKMETNEHGAKPETPGWFVVHASETRWFKTERFGAACTFEGAGAARFADIGINIHVVAPGQPACLYHRESAQEDFLVLSGECRVLIEEQEIALRPGHFVHCPPGVNHVFVGGDRGPCAILMIGHRPEPNELCYPVSELAGRFGASAEAETHEPRQAYGPVERVETSGTWPLS